MITNVAIALMLAMSIVGTIPADHLSAADSEGYIFVPLAPISFKDEFQKGSTIPLRFQLFDHDGTPITNAYAWVLVNGEPGRSPGNSNHYNEFRLNGVTYTFNFDTKPYSAGAGPRDLKLTVEIMIGSAYPLLLWESFSIRLC